MLAPPLEFDLLGPATVAEWLAFFDGPAFADNPAWGSCYCRCLVFGALGREAWEQACATPGENRDFMTARIAAGGIDGVLARREGTTIGWLHFGPAPRFVSPIGTRWGTDPEDGAVACFLIHPAHRGAGVAGAMLARACAALAARGFRRVHALAARDADAMHAFTGPLALYTSEGFALTEDPAPGSGRVRVTRELGPADRLLEPVGAGFPRTRHRRAWHFLWTILSGGDALLESPGIFAHPDDVSLGMDADTDVLEAAIRHGTTPADGACVNRLLEGPFRSFFVDAAARSPDRARAAYHAITAAAARLVAPRVDDPALARAVSAEAARRVHDADALPPAEADRLAADWYGRF